MAADLSAVCLAANHPRELARFWSVLLGRERDDAVTLRPDGDAGLAIRFVPTDEPKTGRNWAHFELTSDSRSDQQRTVARR